MLPVASGESSRRSGRAEEAAADQPASSEKYQRSLNLDLAELLNAERPASPSWPGLSGPGRGEELTPGWPENVGARIPHPSSGATAYAGRAREGSPMRFMIIRKADAETEANAMPTRE